MGSSLHDNISELVGAIYEAPYGEGLWRKMSADVRSALDCRSLLFAAVDAKKPGLCSSLWVGPDDSAFSKGIEEYGEEFHRTDPTIEFAATNPLGRFCDTRDLGLRETAADDPFMRWFADRFKSPHFAVCYTPATDGLMFGLSVHPGHKDAVDYELLRFLFYHVARSASIAARPPSLENEADAVLLVQSSGKVVALSPQAELFISENDGLSLKNGRLIASSTATTNAISRAIVAASAPAVHRVAGDTILVERPSSRREWLLTVKPLASPVTPVAALRAQATITIVDPSRARAISDEACDRFRFTARERQIADLLVTGHSSSSVSKCLAISENTVRVHLQSLFRKTQTKRQAELITLLLPY